MKHKRALLFLFLLPVHLFGQIVIKGNIKDSISNKPVEFATIYANGTTNGTQSTLKGEFTLNKVNLPCELVVSHVGYITKSILIHDAASANLEIVLSRRIISIKEVTVTDKNLRENHLRLFKEQFLGMDNWGTKAIIKNDKVLRFWWEYKTVKFKGFKILKQKNESNTDIKLSDDSTFAAYNFKVSASEPLIIDLPLLGYKLRVDLVDFNYQYNTELKVMECQYLGYYYYQPYKPKSKSALRRIERKRLDAYYNSSLHFCKSLFDKKLKENGYRVYEKIVFDDTTKNYIKEVNLDSNVVYTNNSAKYTGYNNRKFYILYYPDFKKRPLDSNNKGRNPIQSQLYFTKETCTINADGTISDNSIMFSPFIGSKQIGAALPADFEPVDD